MCRPSQEQLASSNGVDICVEGEEEITEVKVSSEPEVERSSPVPPPMLEEEVGPPERSSPSRDSKSSTPTGSSGDDDVTKTG